MSAFLLPPFGRWLESFPVWQRTDTGRGFCSGSKRVNQWWHLLLDTLGQSFREMAQATSRSSATRWSPRPGVRKLLAARTMS